MADIARQRGEPRGKTLGQLLQSLDPEIQAGQGLRGPQHFPQDLPGKDAAPRAKLQETPGRAQEPGYLAFELLPVVGLGPRGLSDFPPRQTDFLLQKTPLFRIHR